MVHVGQLTDKQLARDGYSTWKRQFAKVIKCTYSMLRESPRSLEGLPHEEPLNGRHHGWKVSWTDSRKASYPQMCIASESWSSDVTDILGLILVAYYMLICTPACHFNLPQRRDLKRQFMLS